MSALATLFDRLDVPKPTARKRKRRATDNRYQYVRRVRGGAWQARVWLNARDGGLNLGLFSSLEHGEEDAEWMAARASKEFVKLYKPGVSLRMVLETLKSRDLIPQHVLPPRGESVHF